MSKTPSTLQSLVRKDRGASQCETVPRPAPRWVLRFALPVFIVLAAIVLLAYVARDALLPTVEVDVVPVVTKAAAADESGAKAAQTDRERGEPQVIAHAPGWVEPAPYAVTVPSLIAGVVEEVYVLEGDAVQRGDVIARLIDDDARLALRRARTELTELEASADRARAAMGAAEARLAELDDELERKAELVEVGGVSPGEFTRLKHRARSQRSTVEAARAEVRQAEAAIERQQVAVDEAELNLERTVIRAPVDGVVMTRSVVPGTRIAMAGDGPGEQHFPGVVRLYNPEKLQVRADVPLSDAGKVGMGTKARITTEAMPDRTFAGEVTRIVHRADMQRNTVQVKVRIDDPSPLLKPDMLARVRFLSAGDEHIALHENSSERSGDDAGSLRVYAPQDVIDGQDGDRARVWVVEPGRDGRSYRAVRRDITIGRSEEGMVLVRNGLRPGDRLVRNPPPTIKPGMRVRIRQAATARHAETEEH